MCSGHPPPGERPRGPDTGRAPAVGGRLQRAATGPHPVSGYRLSEWLMVPRNGCVGRLLPGARWPGPRTSRTLLPFIAEPFSCVIWTRGPCVRAVSRRSQQACLAVEAPFSRTRRRQGRNLGRGVRQGPGRAEGPAATGLQPGRREQAVQEAVSAWTWPLPGAWPRFSVFPKEGSSCLLINQETAVPGRREGAPGRGGPGDLGPLQEATSLP